MRDAERHRHRTGPATSAIVVAVAGSVVLAFLLAGTFRADALRTCRSCRRTCMMIATGDAEPEARDTAAARAASALPDARGSSARAPRSGRWPGRGPARRGLSDTELRLLYPMAGSLR